MNNRGFFLQTSDQNHVWHPFDYSTSQNIVIKKAKGVYYTDINNKKYIDAISSWWVNIHGHGHVQLRNSLIKQFRKADHVIFSGFSHEPAIRLSKSLLDKTKPIFTKVFFSDNGSTAVEVALKLGMQHLYQKGYKKIALLAFENAYHGDTFGAMSVGGRSIFTSDFTDLLFHVNFIPTPSNQNITQLIETVQHLQKNNDAVLFIYEPLVQGAGGMCMYEKTYMQKLLAQVKQQPNICIADEVMTGFYRTGTFVASEQIHEVDKNLAPDLMCLSKGITGGVMPLSVTLINTQISESFKSTKFYHGHSYTGNPLACALAVESLRLFDEKKLEAIKSISDQHHAFCNNIAQNELVKNVQVLGTILRMEIHTKEESGYNHSLRNIIYDFFIGNGILLRPLGNVIYVMPPYCITAKELQRIYKTIEKFLTHLQHLNN